MTKKIEQMKIGGKLTFGYVMVILLMIILAVFSLLGANFLNTKINNYVYGAQAADTAVKQCRIEVNNAARNIREMALNDDTSTYDTYVENIETSLTALGQRLQELEDADVLDDSLCQKYTTALNDWAVIGNKIVDELKAGDKKEATRMILEECAPALQNAIEIAHEIDEVTGELKEIAIRQSMSAVIFNTVIVVVMLAAAILLSYIIGKRIIRSIVRPLREIEEAALEMSEGNLRTQIEYHADNEIGQLAHGLRSSIHTLSSYIDDIDRAMREFSEGNFDVQANVVYKGDFISIENSFYSFEARMAETVKNIQSVANQVSAASEQVSESSAGLAEGAGEQAGIIEELTETIQSVSEHVRENAQDAKAISSEVQDVGVEIDNSNGKMQEMVKSMNEINDSSQQISKIIATINDIASQTNLLALNASIEAARAGEAGKGFAVVADQVSVLASQSADAAKESTALIETSVRAVENGMLIADETAKQLEHVVRGSKEITLKVNGIADASEEQAESITRINTGVEHINEVVQTNSATSEECAAASQEMSAQAETLKDLIRHFKVASSR